MMYFDDGNEKAAPETSRRGQTQGGTMEPTRTNVTELMPFYNSRQWNSVLTGVMERGVKLAEVMSADEVLAMMQSWVTGAVGMQTKRDGIGDVDVDSRRLLELEAARSMVNHAIDRQRELLQERRIAASVAESEATEQEANHAK